LGARAQVAVNVLPRRPIGARSLFCGAFGHGVGANEVLWTPDIVALVIFNAPPPAQRFFPTTRGEIGSHEKD
jgi:hypothetical protein